MKIAVLGYGKEGHSVEVFFSTQDNAKQNHEIQIFDKITPGELANLDLSAYDLVLRSPSVPPLGKWSSSTKYFFEHCPCPIIGVTGTKGKGTTCSIIKSVLEKLGKRVFLVGNIGNPALDVLKQIKAGDIVVYEMSSFQLWDLEISPHIAVVLYIEPDHLNVHKDYAEYIAAKANITKHQHASDYCIYCQNNSDSTKIANFSQGKKLPYPTNKNRSKLDRVLASLNLPGQHNQENAEAALCAVAAYYNISLEDLIDQHHAEIVSALQSFQGLPHRLQFLRELNQVRYYDDNFSTTPTSLKVALAAFPDSPLVLIAGGRDKTSNQDLPEIVETINNAKTLQKVILIGESGHELIKLLPPEKIQIAESLSAAVSLAKKAAESLHQNAIVLMSPAAASFDMFTSVYDRGDQFQKLIQEL